MHSALMTRMRTSDLCKAVLEVKPVDGEGWGPKLSHDAGRKQSEWVCWLNPRLLEAFEGLRKAGVKFRSRLLQELAHEFWWVYVQGTMNNLQIPKKGSYWLENELIAGCNNSWTFTMLCSCLRGDDRHVVLKITSYSDVGSTTCRWSESRLSFRIVWRKHDGEHWWNPLCIELRQWPHIRISGRYTLGIHDIGRQNFWGGDLPLKTRCWYSRTREGVFGWKVFLTTYLEWHIRPVRRGGWFEPSFHILLKNLVHFRVIYIVAQK